MSERTRPFIVFGTRPEAIKMAPIILAMRADDQFEPVVCSTGQHREMLHQVVDYFEITPDINLDVMMPDQTLATLTARLLVALDEAVEQTEPDCIIVQGDTTSAMVGSMIAFYRHIPCLHVEAGLRTGDMQAPWPEEFNRRVVGLTTSIHCAPTERARKALLNENIDPDSIYVTGNPVIDALNWSVARERGRSNIWQQKFDFLNDREFVLITAHRRESFGQSFEDMCLAISDLAESHPDIAFVYPVHLNPNVQRPVKTILGNLSNVYLIPPSPYPEFVYLMDRCKVILTDSGGIQEEAPTLKKPAVVMRETTERPEAAEVNAIRLVGTNRDLIVDTVDELLTNEHAYRSMQVDSNPFGDGTTAQAVCAIVKSMRGEPTPVS